MAAISKVVRYRDKFTKTKLKREPKIGNYTNLAGLDLSLDRELIERSDGPE